MKASTCDLKALGERMKSAREALNLTQSAFYEQYGDGSVRTYQKNEAGSNEAGICLANSFVNAGINANWLLTGDGPMLLADLNQEKSYSIDFQCLQKSIQAVEEGLSGSSRRFDPSKKAELILAVYDLFQEPSVSKENVLKLVRLAA